MSIAPTPRLEVLDAGHFVSVQDAGRTGYRTIGVPLAGALDKVSLAAANALLGNAPEAPALEIRLQGPSLKLVEGSSARFALIGTIGAEVIDPEGARRPVPPLVTCTLRPGEVLKVGRCEGTAYLAVSGGFAATRSLGSASTYARAGLGGIKGRAPRRGDTLGCGPAPAGPDMAAPLPLPVASGPIRVMPGPQDDHFTPEALAVFFSAPYTLTPAMDRMGLRLAGPRLTHNALGPDILSDGITPGAIQVPADGAPIILLADGQTTGGYTKIATVIRADLPRLAHLRPGDTLHFAAVTRAQADLARKDQREALARWCASIVPHRPPGQIDVALLLGTDLTSGVTAGYPEESSDAPHPQS